MSNPFHAIVDRINLKHIVLDGGVYSVVISDENNSKNLSLYAVCSTTSLAELAMREATKTKPRCNVYLYTRSRNKFTQLSAIESQKV